MDAILIKGVILLFYYLLWLFIVLYGYYYLWFLILELWFVDFKNCKLRLYEYVIAIPEQTYDGHTVEQISHRYKVQSKVEADTLFHEQKVSLSYSCQHLICPNRGVQIRQ